MEHGVKNIILLASLSGLLALSACKLTVTDTNPGGAGGGCVTCSDSINGADGDFCDATSEQIYNDFEDCICNGPCAAVCGDNICDSFDATPDCEDCYNDESPSGCGQSYNDCLAD